MIMHGEEAPAHKVLLGGRPEPDRNIRLPHGEFQHFVVQYELKAHIRVELHELRQSRGEPPCAEGHGCRYLELTARFATRVRQHDLRGGKLAEHVLCRAIQKFPLLCEHESAGMAVEQRHIQVAFKCADVPAHGRLAYIEGLAGMSETAGFGGGMENAKFVPIHLRLPAFVQALKAAIRLPAPASPSL